MRQYHKTVLVFCVCSLMATGCGSAQRSADVPAKPAVPAIWDLDALKEPPAFRWLDRSGTVWSLVYEGRPYQDKAKTEVFAYYASPDTLAGDTTTDGGFPGIVLIHGGGGTAFNEWAELWAKRGYAAIAMDLYGCMPDKQKLELGGPSVYDNGPTTFNAFSGIDRPLIDQWPYHAVSNVILSHSLLRAMPGVDANRIAVTGISWGGYLTCIAAGLDHRFKAAVPVYGCGFLYENSAWLPHFAGLTPEQKAKWIEWFEPSRYVGAAQMPMFFVNGTNDFAYPIDSWSKTAALTPIPSELRLTVKMPHDHPHGWSPQEIYWFIDHHLRGGTPLPVVAHEQIKDGQLTAHISTSTRLAEATLHYTTQEGPVNKREWIDQKAEITANRIHTTIPHDASIWFLTVKDERGAIVSGKPHFADAPAAR